MLGMPGRGFVVVELGRREDDQRRVRPGQRPSLARSLAAEKGAHAGAPPDSDPVVPFEGADLIEQLRDLEFGVLRRRRHHRRGVALDAATRGLRTALVEARRLRQRHVVEELQARPRRPPLPAAGRRPPRVRGAPRAPATAAQRAPPRRRAAVPDPDPDQGRVIPAEDRQGARLGDVDVRPHGRRPHRQAAPAARGRRAAFAHLPTMPRRSAVGGYLYYDAATDDARLVLTIARTAADHGAVVANRCASSR